MNIQIHQITMKNFRNQQDKTAALGPVTLVSGHNGVGKSTLAHAVAYAFFGVGFGGSQDIDRLRCNPDAPMGVRLVFTDGTGRHTLDRIRRGDKTSLSLDSYTVRQAEIIRMVCDKETFLSIFNPLYFPTQGSRELLLKHLQPVSIADALSQMPEACRKSLEGMEIHNPMDMLKDYRKQLRDMEDSRLIMEGRIDAANEAAVLGAQKTEALRGTLERAEKRLKALQTKQFEGIDQDELIIRQGILTQKLDAEAPAAESEQLTELKTKLQQVQTRTYASKYAAPLEETKAKIQMERQRYCELKGRLEKLQPGAACPFCLTPVTAENAPAVQEAIARELRLAAEKGSNLVAQYKQLTEYAAKEKEIFLQYRQEDAVKIQRQIQAIQPAEPGGQRQKLRQELANLEDTLRMGNLSEAEMQEFHSLEAEITGIQAEIATLSDLPTDAIRQAEEAYRQLSHNIQRCKGMVSALSELAVQQTALAIKQLDMPHTSIQLWEIVPSTGELRSVFKILYDGREFASLSLSEQMLAGLELSAMFRRITGLMLPVCIDNTESLAALPRELLPEQTILMKVVKNRPLTVQVQGREPQAPSESLQKAA